MSEMVDLTGKRRGARDPIRELRDRIGVKRFNLTGDLAVDPSAWPTDLVIPTIYTQPATGGPYSVTYAGQAVPIGGTGSTLVDWVHDGAAWRPVTGTRPAPTSERYQDGGYYYPVGGRSSFAAVPGRLTVVPFQLGRAVTVKAIAVDVVTAAPGSVVRLGIYDMGAGGAPTSLVAELGSVSGGVVGPAEVSVPSLALPPGLYGLAAVVQGGSPAVRTLTGSAAISVGARGLFWAVGAGMPTGYLMVDVFGALPTVFTFADHTVLPTLVAVKVGLT